MNKIKIRNPVAKHGPKFNRAVRFSDRNLKHKQGYEKHKSLQEKE